MSPDESATLTPSHVGSLPILDRMRELNVPGVSVALVEHGDVVAQAAYGTKTAGDDAPVEETTRFQACSISKPVTSLGMLRLVEQGRLDLDADVNDTLRAWRIPSNGAMGAARHAATPGQPLGRPDRPRVPRLSARGDVADAPAGALGSVPGQHRGRPRRHRPGRAVPLLRRWDDRHAAAARGGHGATHRRPVARARPRTARDDAQQLRATAARGSPRPGGHGA